MDLKITPSAGLRGEVRIPPNKSHSFRALIMAGLAEGVSRITAPAVSADWHLGVAALEMFGAKVSQYENVWEITGTGGAIRVPDDVIDCGNSGIILRFFMALAACCDGYSMISGDHSIRHIRPCQPLIDAINALGGWAVSTKNDGRAPIVVKGPLRGGTAEIDGQDSQPVSALLIAAALAEGKTTLNVRNPGEKPWVGVTLGWLDRCGVRYKNENFKRYTINGGQRWKGFDVTIPCDWSAALYPIVAGLVTPDSEVRVLGMDFKDSQGDRMVLEVLRGMGADIEMSDDGTVIARSSRLVGREIDCNDFIDQFMLLAVVGALAEGETVLTNAEICRHKECDRIAEMENALKAMGAEVRQRPDGLVIRHSRLRGADLDSRDDHRMVMTLAVAAMAAEGPSVIRGLECVKKTFPDFVEQMQKTSAKLEKI